MCCANCDLAKKLAAEGSMKTAYDATHGSYKPMPAMLGKTPGKLANEKKPFKGGR